jgi:hypothetical protein
VAAERRVALIHRVIMPDKDYPKEYAVLVTDERSIFIRQKQTRSSFVLRGEMRYGTALVTDVEPRTLEYYEQFDLDALTADAGNLSVPHDSIISLDLKGEVPAFRKRDFFVWLTMRRQGEIFQVYFLEMTYENGGNKVGLKFYLVPLGAWFKPRRQTQDRETILREYAEASFKIYRSILRPDVLTT